MASCMETRVGNEEEAPVWAEENKALVRRFLEAQATSDLEPLDELLAPDFVDHTLLPGQDPSRQGYLRAIAEGHAALSDIGTTIDYQATDGDDIVITRHTAHSIHDRGALLGMEPTGKEWKLTHIDMHRI
jgi:ketosteroid isomerase-like protein